MSLVVLVELVWVLTRVYGASATDVSTVVRTLVSSPQIEVQAAPAVERAMSAPADLFADAVIHALGQAAGCERTATFDRRFAAVLGADLLT